MAQAEISVANGRHGVVLDVKDDNPCNPAPAGNKPPPCASKTKEDSISSISVPFIQKLIAEMVGTYFLIFAGCTSVAANLNYDKVVTLPGISIVWGLAVMVLVYSVGHISGAHFNPLSLLPLPPARDFPGNRMQEAWSTGALELICFEMFIWDYYRIYFVLQSVKVPAYIACQVTGSTLAAGTIRLIFTGKQDQFTGTLPAGSDMQSFVVEFIITFYLMFIISGVATDNRAIGELAGLAVGATVLLNVMFAGAISGASMNPARSLGPAIVSSQYKGLWIYIVSPILGAQAGAWVYNMIRYTDKPLREITMSASFLKNTGRA
ncbi:hypothetical protein GH714_004150 [Hevea brasiliensis]|uniref:NOD26-like intrinsic protein n=1 Tax=Hevea brasiliensis TaxID=3981 RepID=A0A6A6LV59_HEVBR|nr:hypothetical protein GH714_004150 [Hevea brasiliensis]